MPFRFASPSALLLLLLVPALVIISRRSLAGLPPFRRWSALCLRIGLLLLLAFALAEIQWIKEGKDLTVFFLVDQSRSVPPGSRRQAAAYVNEAARAAGKHDRAGLILFGHNAGIEKFPDNVPTGNEWFRRSSLVVNRDRTNLEGAVRLALAAFPENSRKRVVLLTDGCENEGFVLDQADVARSLNCPIDIGMINYEHRREVLLDKALMPPKLRAGEPFELRVVIKALQNCDAELSLGIDGQPFETGRKISLNEGKEVVSFSFPEGLSEPGPYTFEASIRSSADTIPENNSAVAHTWVAGKARKVLLVDSDTKNLSYLLGALAAEDMDAAAIRPAQMPAAITQLRRYDCLVLSNVAAHHFAPEQLGMIEAAVKELGMGLVLVGGEESFGPGGFRDTPIESCSPVDFDIRQKRVMPKGAIVLVMDAAEDANANRWAIEMSSAAVKVLSYHDEVGIIANGQWYLSIREVKDKHDVFAAIDNMSVWDNDMFESLLRTALPLLKKSDAASKHVLIMTDGGHRGFKPSKELQKDLLDARVTVSVVVFHPHPGTEAQVVKSLKRLAYVNGGRFYYPRKPGELAQIFFKEATMITRSLIHEQPFQPLMALATDPVRGFEGFPKLGGYVLTTPKPRARVPIVRSYRDDKLDEQVNDPILAHWRYGLGKVAAFTSDAKNRWGAQWVGWPGYKKFWPQVVRWALPASAVGSATVRSSIDVRDDKAKLSVDILDASGRPMNFLELRGSALTPRADASGRLESIPLDLRQTGSGRYEAEFDAGDPGAYFVSLAYSGGDAGGNEISGTHTTAAAVPYSAEFRDLTTNTPLLKKIAENSGGRLLGPETNIFDRNLPAARASQPIWPLLLFLSVVVFPADVAVRKIVVDWRSLASVVLEKLAGMRPTPKPEAQVDTGMGRLLSRKQKTHETLSDDQPAILRGADTEPTGADEVSDIFAGPQQSRPGAKQQPPPQAAPEPEVNEFTQRLIQAKKRIKKKRADSDT